MPSRVLVAGPRQVLEAVQRALPDEEVHGVAELSRAVVRDADCVVIDRASVDLDETWKSLVESTPVVEIGLGNTEPEGQAYLSSAVRGAILERRAKDLLDQLTDAWAHDARGALGVARLGLELLKTGGDPQKPIEKIENGLMRLGWLLERLPSQVALALDLPVAVSTAPSLFPSLESYVTHVRRTHPRRQIELSGAPWTSSTASRALVPFASGLVELAFRLSSGRTALQIGAGAGGDLCVECDCPDRPPPWDVRETLNAFELSHRSEAFVPYRLIEAARLAERSELPLTVELSERTFRGRVHLGELALGD